MAELQQKSFTISMHLSRVLDEIGLNELTMEKQRETFLLRENILSVFLNVCDNLSMYIFGSMTEGTTTPELNADVDLLYCFQNFNVMQDLAEWTKGNPNLLMLRDRTAPGYCRLQLIQKYKPEPEDRLLSQDHTYDECQRVILKHSALYNRKPWNIQTDKHGPAHTFIDAVGFDTDLTYAFICTSILDATNKWAGRTRSYGWPTASLITQVVTEPFFLVPVGYKLSDSNDIEWRISTSLAERRLMFSLNIVQVKTYVTLKILNKTYMSPEIDEGISSYHCKTALLYCIESTEAGFWREDNLLQNITCCLEMLLVWISDGVCPHFIIPEANLFAGKVTSKNKATLLSVLRRLIQRDELVNCLLAVSIDGLGHKLHNKLSTRPESSPVLDSIATIKLSLFFERRKQFSQAASFLGMFSQLNIAEAGSKVITGITIIECYINRTPNKLKQRAAEHVIKFLYGFLGSLYASFSISRQERISQEANDLLDASSTSDISSLLKKASIHYCSGETDAVEKICKKIVSNMKRNIVYPNCACYPHYYHYSYGHFQAIYYENSRNVQYANCLMFSVHELYCVPQALRYELFRAVGDDICQRQFFDNWMVLAVVDCLPFLYYLQYMTYRELGHEELRRQSLNNMDQYIRDENQFMCHIDTAFNILGQCQEMEKRPVAALCCYKKSLDIRPRNNAANWLVPLLLYKMHKEMTENA